MIEVEKKFILNQDQEKRLTEKAYFLGQKEFTDIYYDDANYSLTTKDIWLRERNGKFELKVPMNESIEKRISDQYIELESVKDILKYFNADDSQSFNDLLSNRNFHPFCEITTTRKKYKKNEFNIDLDSMDFGYTLAEIEYMTDDKSKISQATQSIIKFAEQFSIDVGQTIRGKVVEYLRVNKPNHFQALVDARVIKN